MTEILMSFFESLVQDRTEIADVLDKPAVSGLRNSASEKYSDEAHFVYELLQNADDVKATKAVFELSAGRLLFRHNGSEHFTISDPATEEEDKKNHRLGHVNAITSYGARNKQEKNAQGNVIGKFGLGFKSIFQYTKSPSIYDDNIWFRLEREIIPRLLDHDFEGRKEGETLFSLPLDNEEIKTPEEDIKRKFDSLLFPTLFLNNLSEICLKTDAEEWWYKKSILEEKAFDETTAKLICLKKIKSTEEESKKLWIFSRTDSNNHKYSVGFELDENGSLKPSNYKAFCFFPTKHTTHLKFLIHAPFLLNESREVIKANDKDGHNVHMIDLLSQLAAESLLLLRDIGEAKNIQLINDNILKIIPLTEIHTEKDELSFNPFFITIFNLFQTERIVPSQNGCIKKEFAIWPFSQEIPSVFSDENLQDLYRDCEEKNHLPIWLEYELEEACEQATKQQESQKGSLRWAFVKNSYAPGIDPTIRDFIEGCTKDRPTAIALLANITPAFIEKQTDAWLSTFYDWVTGDKERVRKCRTLPIFKDEQGHALPALDDKDNSILFLPATGSDTNRYKTVAAKFLKDENAKALLDTYHIRTPAEYDLIRQIITKQLPEATNETYKELFSAVFRYYIKSPNDEQKAISDMFVEEEIKLKIIPRPEENITPPYYFTPIKPECPPQKVEWALPRETYFHTEELQLYFENTAFINFVDEQYYSDFILNEQEKLKQFFAAIGVLSAPRRLHSRPTWRSPSPSLSLPSLHFGSPSWSQQDSQRFILYYIENADDFLERLCKITDANIRINLSKLFWNFLRQISEAYTEPEPLGRKRFIDGSSWTFLSGKHLYKNYQDFVEWFESPQVSVLRSKEWLLDNRGNWVSPQTIHLSDLPSAIYNTTACSVLVTILRFRPEGEKDEEVNARENLSEEDKETFRLGEELKRRGFSIKDIEEYNAWKSNKEQKKSTPKEEENDSVPTQDPEDEIKKDSPVLEKISKGVKEKKKESSIQKVQTPQPQNSAADEIDDDELLPKAIDYEEKIKRQEGKQIAQITTLENAAELQAQALKAPKYSYGWFKTLLELEMLEAKEATQKQHEVTLTFTQIVQEHGTERTFILKRPNRAIPTWVEEISGIPLQLTFADRKPVLAIIEVMSIQSFNLRVRLKVGHGLDKFNLEDLVEAKLQVQKPTFLLDELMKGLESLNYEDTRNLKADLSEDIEFIFGPPGTGKTTFLATDKIIPLMRANSNCRVLVLAPTNKAADVLTNRIISRMEGNETYHSWLIRFGTTLDESLEKTGVCVGKDVDLKKYPRYTLVTTIARFPYDSCITGNSKPLLLKEETWDYIIIDEASMIPLVNIIYPLYQQTQAHFIIAGDPFQIEPVITNALWKDENIYTMVGLKDFANPKTEPHDYLVTRLTTQYRSVPAVGQIFSQYQYNGILTHKRGEEETKNLVLKNFPVLRPLTKLTFPVSPYESIYRLKRLGLKGGSSYQIYSALFAFEFVLALAKRIPHQDKVFRIGVISPYRAQASLVQKLIESETNAIPSHIEILAGTVHGFQGDECEMIVALFNPPPGISASSESFINKQNIINVAISRARDYLVLVMPNDETPNIENMREIRKVERLMRQNSSLFTEYKSSELETSIFSSNNYIESNCFSTGHQDVNVYGIPDKRYEVRSEDTAIDIQIHKRN